MRRAVIVLVLSCFTQVIQAQGPGDQMFKVKGDQMWIKLPRNISIADAEQFAAKYNLRDIGLVHFVKTGKNDSLIRLGWMVKADDKHILVMKPLGTIAGKSYPEGKVIFTPVPTPDNWREVGGNRTTFGFNRFDNGKEFRREKNLVFFFLEGYNDAKEVRLAGNFTNWQHAAFPMRRVEGGWQVQVKLDPGQYYYKFIINGNYWITDPKNEITENDGRGNENSVFFVANEKFSLKNHESANRVYLSGTFNNWARNQIPLKKTAEGWYLEMFIEEGTYKYHYLVDGRIVKPDGTEQQQLAIGKPHVFRLEGAQQAKRVIVAGNFNDWNEEELSMKKTAGGWELSYTLGPGNYQYKFIVDGDWRVDPGNPLVLHDDVGNQNSFMVIGGNHTFRLNGFESASNVYVTGDFTDYSLDGVQMNRVSGGWEARVYLGKGKHRYYFIVDGKAIRDPSNKAWEWNDDHRHERNSNRRQESVIWIDPNQLQ